MQIPGGMNGQILRVNLETGQMETQSLSPGVYRRYLGGRGLGAYLALRHLSPGVDPLGPDNVLIAAPGLLTGTIAPAAPRFSLVARSPLTGTVGQTEAGGFWGPELKRAGYDALIITGRASKPVYLYISPEGVRVRPAGHLWGHPTAEVQEKIVGECGGGGVRILQIGPAGENLVRFACVINELRHANGRNGLGAVFGAKNLRAIAVRADGELPVHDSDTLREAARWAARATRKHPLSATLHRLGTPAGVANLHAAGMLPTRNFRRGRFPGYECIDGETMKETISVGAGGCHACAVRCKRRVRTADTDETYGGPEYETVAAFGPMLENDDLSMIARCHALCNALGLDTISAGSTIAWAMECAEAGTLTRADVGDEPPRFGDAHRLPDILRDIAQRRGLGELLAEGSERAAARIGRGSERFLTTVKGQEAPLQEPRAMGNMALGFAVSPTGADHVTAAGDGLFSVEEAPGMEAARALGILCPRPPRDLSGKKIRLYLYMHFLWSLYDSLGLCYFGYAPRSVIPLPRMVEIVRAVTGWESTMWELLKAGQRAVNLTRVANVREGFSSRDDVLPERFFQPIEGEGPLRGAMLQRAVFERARQTYYAMMGWDAAGIPADEVLDELDLTWCREYLPTAPGPAGAERGEVESRAVGASDPDAPAR